MARNKLSETSDSNTYETRDILGRRRAISACSDAHGAGWRGKRQSRMEVHISARRHSAGINLGGHGKGTAPVSLALAREKAQAERERIARGETIVRRKTFLDVMEDVLAVKESIFQKDKHRAQWRMTL